MQIKLQFYEEKNCHRIISSICFGYSYDSLQVKFRLPCLRRVSKIPKRDPLLILRTGGTKQNAMKKPVIRFFILFTLLTAYTCLLHGQEIAIDSPNSTPIEERLIYNHQNSFNIGIHSQGFGLGFKIGKIKDIYTTSNWETEFFTLNSLKEIRLVSGYASNLARPFKYGKLNTVFGFRFGYGQEKRIYGKPYWGGVELRWIYEGGVSLALQKPYYYYVLVYKGNSEIEYAEAIEERIFDDPDKSRWLDIVGKASLTKGFGEIKPSPGIHAKCGFSFDIGTSRARYQAINFGVVAECYPMGISIIDSQRDRRFFLTFFLSYNWGSRFNK